MNMIIYCPTHCLSNTFSDLLTYVEEWTNNIENIGIRPIILINRDFNFPFMGMWTEEKVCD